MRDTTGIVEITISYRRYVGPMHVHGGLTLRFDSSRPYGFVSQVQWPNGDNYESAVRSAVEEELRAHQGALKSTLVQLTSIEWNEIDSSELGFRRAAAAATRAAFEV